VPISTSEEFAVEILTLPRYESLIWAEVAAITAYQYDVPGFGTVSIYPPLVAPGILIIK
jgi:hypothetical protein